MAELFDIRSIMLLGCSMVNHSEKSKPPHFWEGQMLHIVSLIVLLTAAALVWTSLGNPHSQAFWIAISFPILHQVWVWTTWRIELQTSIVSRSIGFNGYLLVFALLFVGRLLSLAWLALQDRGSLNLDLTILVPVTFIVLLPGLYAMFSVARYFGIARAAGADHFNYSYRELPLVKEGIFRYTDNGMYVFAFLLFWAVAIGFNSISALVVAAFSHAYIWVHYYSTEKPDMDYLYGGR